MENLKESLLKQFDELIALYNTIPQGPDYRAPSRVNAVNEFGFGALSAIERTTGENSSQSKQARVIANAISETQGLSTRGDPDALVGMVKAVRKDIAAGYLEAAQTLIRAEVFGDFLEQAEYLLSEHYKDAAAVMCGGVLETHLRNLCIKVGVAVTEPDGRAKKAGKMNDDLTKAKAYSANEQKQVTSWLGFRNSAAHANYGEYDAGQIKTMIEGVRGFLSRNPA